MNTRQAAPLTGATDGAAAASRIVRIVAATWPLVVMAVVSTTVALAVPHDAWLPFSAEPASAAAWQQAPHSALAWLSAWQVSLGALVWPADPVGGGIAVAAIIAAAATGLLAMTLAATGLPASLSALLALVAVGAPFGGWQASSPLAAGPAALASVCLLYAVVRRGAPLHTTNAGRLSIALVALIGVAEVVAGGAAPRAMATGRLVYGDLGLPGLVLVAAAAARFQGALEGPTRVWLGLGATWLLTMPLGSEVRSAAVLPWIWWLVGAGLAEVLAWRGPRAVGWAAAGLTAWVGLHAGQTAWTHQRQQAALIRTWADGVVTGLGGSQPLVSEASARDTLLGALARHRHRQHSDAGPVVVGVDDTYVAVRGGGRAVVTTAALLDRLRWQGLAFAQMADGPGHPLERVLRALPAGTVVLAGISADAAAAMTPAQWQALGRTGLRLADAGAPRAHALVGITGARVEALEAARAGSVRLDVLPGDPLGRTGTRSPVDARIDAGEARVSITLRGRPFLIEQPGLVLIFLSGRGEFLGWRAGRTPGHLDGAPLGSGPETRVEAISALPCVDLPDEGTADITALASTGALGLTWPAAGRVEVSLLRRADQGGRGVRLAETASSGLDVELVDAGTPPSTFTIAAQRPRSAGVYLRGAVTQARASATRAVRICGAWPVPHTLEPGRTPLVVGVSPRDEGHFGHGWHDAEVQAEGGYFRWMAEPRADLLLALRAPSSLSLTVDAQAPAEPGPGDEVRLMVNGQDIGSRALLPTRGLYTWAIPPSLLQAGMNTVSLATTTTVRPADRQPGADGRRLGLLVRGWTLTAAPATPDAAQRETPAPNPDQFHR